MSLFHFSQKPLFPHENQYHLVCLGNQYDLSHLLYLGNQYHLSRLLYHVNQCHHVHLFLLKIPLDLLGLEDLVALEGLVIQYLLFHQSHHSSHQPLQPLCCPSYRWNHQYLSDPLDLLGQLSLFPQCYQLGPECPEDLSDLPSLEYQ